MKEYLCARNLTPDREFVNGNIAYLMHREQRLIDNDALIYSYNLALRHEVNFYIIFYFPIIQISNNERQLDIILKNIHHIQDEAEKLNIPFYFISHSSIDDFNEFLVNKNINLLVMDFSPLKMKKQFILSLLEKSKISIHEYDAHNIVPVWEASQKKEYGAYTIRKKLHSKLDRYINHFEQLLKFKLKKYPYNDDIENDDIEIEKINNNAINNRLLIEPGYESGMEKLKNFIENKLEFYDEKSNDPTLNYTSNLSTYLNLGHISSKRAVLEILRSNNHNKDGFIEQIFVRRELADNFCYYEKNYDNINGFPNWAKKTLEEHFLDKREYVYKKNEFENAVTHDKYWNAAQMELLKTGKIHNYMRMYWGKKLLEWTENIESALQIAIYLNDKFAIDGNDPNGYTGIAWCIGGVHDRAWKERKILGKIRYMNSNGLKRKFYIEKYVNKLL